MRRRAGRRVRGVRAWGDDDGAAMRPRAVRGLRVRAVEATQARPAQVPAVPGAGAVGKRPYPRGRGSTAPRAARGRRQDRRRGGAATALAGGRTVPRGAGLGGSSGATRRWPRGSPQLAAPRGSRGPRARRGAPGPGRLRRPAAACDFLRAFLGHYPEPSDARGAGAATSLGRGLPLAEAGAPGELPAATATLWTGLARAQLEIGDAAQIPRRMFLFPFARRRAGRTGGRGAQRGKGDGPRRRALAGAPHARRGAGPPRRRLRGRELRGPEPQPLREAVERTAETRCRPSRCRFA